MDNNQQRIGASGIGDQGAEFAELIARLERATGPDRESDVAIWAAITPAYLYRRLPAGQSYSTWQINRSGTALNPIWHDYYPHLNVEKYTESFDAARRLIPDGYYWHAGEGKTRDDEPLGAASIIEPGSLDTIAEAEHASVIIAFCIAAMKARAALSKAETR